MFDYQARRRRGAPVWINDSTWVCRQHMPSARLPADAEQCLYRGCPTKRPDRSVVPPAKITKTLTPVPVPPKAKRLPLRLAPPFPITPAPPVAGEAWRHFDAMGEQELYAQRIMALRKYARHVLGMVGASKIRGGKDVLIPLILERRQVA